ncbi:MAG: hypothetical protein PF442_09810, partial [Desulfobulbaceae bacterium]|nr:hypothetical protein [Desulfobulbaceae bacterium]
TSGNSLVAVSKIHLSLVSLKDVLVPATYRGYALIIRIQDFRFAQKWIMPPPNGHYQRTLIGS